MKRGAFTLIEALVTVMIISILGAVIIPTYQLLLSQLQLSTATEQASDQIRLAQQKTVTEQSIYGVTLTTNATTVPLFLYDPVAGTKTPQNTLNLPSNIIISTVSFTNQTDIRFATSGAPNYSGYILLEDTVRGRYRKIEVRPSGNIISNTAEY